MLQNPGDWLKKQLEITDIAVSLRAIQSVETGEPLLRTTGLRIAALAPVFAVVANRAAAGQTTAIFDVSLEPATAALSSLQLSWLRTFVQTIPTVLAARGKHTAAMLFRLTTPNGMHTKEGLVPCHCTPALYPLVALQGCLLPLLA